MECENKLHFEHRLTEVEARSKSNTKRLNEVECRQQALEDLAATMAKMTTKQDHMESDVKDIKADVKAIKEKPAKRWESVVEKIILVIVGAVLTLLLQRVGL